MQVQHQSERARAALRPTVRLLRAGDAARLQRLHADSAGSFPAYWMRSRSAAELAGYLDGTRGLAFGVIEQDQLLSVGLLRLPSPTQPNSGDPFPRIPAADWRLDTAVLDGALVHPAARGLGYQRVIIERGRAVVADLGLRWLAAGVHLANVASWRNLLRHGFAITGTRQQETGTFLTLLTGGDGGRLATDEARSVRVRIDDAQGIALHLAEGYAGVALDHHHLVCSRLVLEVAMLPPRQRSGSEQRLAA